MKIFGKLIKNLSTHFIPLRNRGGTQKKTRNRNSNVLGADGDVERRKRRLKKKVKSTISVFLFCFLAVCGIYKNVTEVKATNFASKVVNIGGPITLEGNYTVTVWRSGNTVYCKAHVYVAAPNGAWSAMGAQVSANKGSASNTFVGNGSATPKAGSGDVQFSFTDAGAGTVSGTIYAGFMPNLNGSQALSATFSVSYPPSNIDSTVPSNNANGKITYVSHCQNVGWQSWVSDGATSGTTGKGLRMETIAIDSKLVGLSYQAHVANKGWMSLKTNGQAAGTVGEALAIQAIKISLTGDNAPYYTLKYRAHVASKGWMSWVNAGEIAGTTGQNLDMQAIEITLTPKSYTVTYNGNGGLYNGSSTWSNTATYNENYTTYSNDNFFTRDGYRFVGWNTKADGSGTDWTGWINKPWQWSYGHGVTLYAQWKANNYTVSINPNGGSYNGTTGITKISQALGTTVEINQIPTRSGYTFVGWTRSGSGSLHSGNSYGRSGITQYEKADADGTAYTNYKMNFNNTTNAGYAYPSIQYFSYGYTSGHTYRLSVDVRVNKSSGNEYAHIRHSAFVNNWVAPSTTVNYLTNGFEHRTVERTFTGTTSEQSGTKYNIYPFVEFYAGIAGGKTGILDFDMKNLTIYDVTAGKYINSNYKNVKNGATVDVGKGDTTITAVWVPNSYQQTVRVRFENADGSFTDYSQAYQANHDYGSTFEWEFPASKQYESTKVSYKVTGAKSTDITVYRKKYTVKILTKTQKLDGTWPDSYSDVSSRYVKSSYRYGEECRAQISLIGAPDTEHPYWEAFAVTENKELKYDLKRYKNTLKIYASLSDKIDEERENKYFTFDFYVADKLVRQSVYNVNDVSIYYGNNYTIKNIQPRNGYHYTNMYFSRNPIHNLDKPTKDENGVFNGYFSGESTYQYSLCISPNTYTINYNGNGATSGTTTSSSHTYNESKSLTKNGFTRTGYTFKGWATNADGSGATYSDGQEVRNLSTKNGDIITLYAQWTPNTYTITSKYYYYYQNNTWKQFDTKTEKRTYGSSFAPHNVNSPTGYHAGNNYGYYTEKSEYLGSGTVGTNNITVNQNIIVHVHYYPNTYTITYKPNGGSGSDQTQTVTYGISWTSKDAIYSRTGYTQTSWNTQANGSGTKYSLNMGQTAEQLSNVTLYAQWTPNSYYLDLNGYLDGTSSGNITGYGTADVYVNGKLVADDVSDYCSQIPYGSTYEIKDIKANPGHVYNGVHSGKLSGTMGAGRTSVELSFSTKVLTATFHRNFNDSDTTTTTQKFKYGQSGQTFNTNTWSRTGYTFLGWSANKNASSMTWPDKCGVADSWIDSNYPSINIHAIWSLNTYSISYNLNGGSMSGQKTSYNVNTATFSLPIPSKTGYTFTGWTGSNGSTPQKSVTIAAGSTGNKSYKANWKANSLTIRYHSNGAFGGNILRNGKWENNVVLDYEQSKDAVVFTDRVEEGASNDGLKQYGLSDYDGKMNNHVYLYKTGYIGTSKYNTNPNGSSIEIDENKPFNSVIELANYLGVSIDSKDNSIDLYPQWKAISYSITYNGNGATSGSMTEQAVTFDKNINLTSNTFLRKYTVTYNAMGGTVNAPNNVASATFKGWEDRGSISFMDKNYASNEFDAPYYSQKYTDLNAAFGFNKYNLVKHFVLYGKSEGRNPKDKTGKVSLYPNKATVKNMTITNGYKVNLYAHWKLGSVTLPTPTRFGYKFLGWYTSAEGGTKITGATYTPTSNVTLYAHWKLDSYYIDYKVNDTGLTDRITDNLSDNNGSLPGKDTAVMLTDFALQNGSKYNTKYTFKEWNTKPDGSGQKFTTSITNDGSLCKPGETLTLYAIWDTTPTITGKNFYMLENMKPASDILTSGKGLDKNPIDHFPDNMKDVAYPVKGYTKNGTDISSKINVDYVEFDGSKTATASIDTKKPGKYTIHYSLTDGKQTKKFTRTITVLSASTPVINAGDRYFNKGSFVTAEMLLSTVTSGDRYDGDLTTKVAVLNMEHVAFNTVGSYDVQYKVTNRSGKTVVKKVKIHILEYLTDNQADKDNKYRYIRKDCSTKNDYCMEYFKEDSKWVTNDELNNQIIDSLSKDKSEEAIKKYHFGKDDVERAK